MSTSNETSDAIISLRPQYCCLTMDDNTRAEWIRCLERVFDTRFVRGVQDDIFGEIRSQFPLIIERIPGRAV